MSDKNIKKAVRDNYAKVATGDSCCPGPVTNCCGQENLVNEISSSIGYTPEDMDKVPEGSNLGLGCGNPLALASLKSGETVVDLGSGGGFDCFIVGNG